MRLNNVSVVLIALVIQAWASGALLYGEDDTLARMQSQAAAGDLAAQIDLGVRLRDGNGIPRDRGAALVWFQRAADAGSARAQDHVGWMHLRGWGTPVDFDAARIAFEKSAADGHLQASFNLGVMYEAGLGVPRNPAKAMEYWTIAADRGHAFAAYAVAIRKWRSPDFEPNPAHAVKYAELAAKRGVHAGQNLLGWFYHEGIGVTKDESRAKRIWQGNEIVRQGSDPAKTDDVDMLSWQRLRKREAQPGSFAFVETTHLDQGWNMCVPTTASIALSASDNGDQLINPYHIKALCPESPLGTGTDWGELVAALGQLDRASLIVVFDTDESGFTHGVERMQTELDAGHPVLIDLREPGIEVNESAHTVAVVGYDNESKSVFLHDADRPFPGIRVISHDHLSKAWQSGGYTRAAERVVRPMVVFAR